MAHSNGIITPPINLTDDVKYVLNESSNDLGILCKSNSINTKSLCKPFKLNSFYEPVLNLSYLNTTIKAFDNRLNRKIKLYNTTNYLINLAGINYPAYNNEADGQNLGANQVLLRSIVGSISSGYQNSTGPKVWIYEKPTGGANSQYRLTDFNGYDKYQNSNIIVNWSIGNSNNTDKALIWKLSNTNFTTREDLVSAFTAPTINTFGSNNTISGLTFTVVGEGGQLSYPLKTIAQILLNCNNSTSIYIVNTRFDLSNNMPPTITTYDMYDDYYVKNFFTELISSDYSKTIQIQTTSSMYSNTKQFITVGLCTKDSNNKIQRIFIPKNGFYCVNRVWMIPSGIAHITDCLCYYGQLNGNIPYSDVSGSGNSKIVRVRLQNNMPIGTARTFYIIVNYYANATTPSSSEYSSTGPFLFYVPIITGNTTVTSSSSSDYSPYTMLEDNFFMYMQIKDSNDNYYSVMGEMVSVRDLTENTLPTFPGSSSLSTSNHPKFRGNVGSWDAVADNVSPSMSNYSTYYKLNGVKLTVMYKFDFNYRFSGNATFINFVASPGIMTKEESHNHAYFNGVTHGATYACNVTNNSSNTLSGSNKLLWYTDTGGNT